MNTRRSLDIHPFSKLLPLPEGLDRENLEKDIKANGVIVPVILFEGKILDGRSRYLIAQKLGKSVPVEHFYGTAKNALELVASYNLHRRHLNQSQKAMLAVKFSEKLQKIDQMPKHEADEIAMSHTGAARTTVERASRILEKDKKAAREIENGRKTVGEFYIGTKQRCPKCGHQW